MMVDVTIKINWLASNNLFTLKKFLGPAESEKSLFFGTWFDCDLERRRYQKNLMKSK